MKPKILFIMHMPPPVHGAAMMGQYIHDSKRINERFDCHYINLTTAKSLQDIGKGGVRKMWKFLCLLVRIVKNLVAVKPQLVYVTPNSHGGAFYKDFVDEQPKLGYEYELLRMSQNVSPVYVLNAQNVKWYEIDDPQDLKYAEEHVLPYCE